MRHERLMRRALELAEKGRGRTSPNPMVGAVASRAGRVVGEGWHARAGEPHAEALALAAAGAEARGADLYVTLEPCDHHGRTPPCTEKIIAAGVRRVFAAMADPNPLVDGRGMARLRGAGVEVRTGLLGDESRRLNEAYVKRVTTGLPLVVMKAAMSLDGKLATRTRDSRWITGEAARRRAHEMRAAADAVMVGSGTVLADDPELTVRLAGPEAPQPRRVVVDSGLRTPPSARIFRAPGGAPVTVAAAPGAPAGAAAALEAAGARVVAVEGRGGRVDLERLLRTLADEGVNSVLLEGGAGLFTSALEAGLVDRVAAFVAPVIIGGEGAPSPVGGRGAETIRDALRLVGVRVEVIGGDVLIEGYLPHSPLAPREEREEGGREA